MAVLGESPIHPKTLRIIPSPEAAGLEELEEKALVPELNLTELPANFSDRLWAAIRKRRPGGSLGVFAIAEFGKVRVKKTNLNRS